MSIKGRLMAVLAVFIIVFTCFGILTMVEIKELEHEYYSIYENPSLQEFFSSDKELTIKVKQLINQAKLIQDDLEKRLVLINIGLAMILTMFSYQVIRSIVKSLDLLKHTMDESAVTGVLIDTTIGGSKEISGIAKCYNTLIQNLRNQFWLKDGQNLLNQEIATSTNLSDMTQKSLNLIVKILGIGKGALYIYNSSNKRLELHASYAYTEKERRFGSYALGEGIIGQAGLDKKPIYLENIKEHEGYISTGVMLKTPINIYTFPLVFEGNTQGVVELVSFEVFDNMKCEFLKEAGGIIASNVYSEIQNQKVKSLLDISEKAQMEARYNSSQLLKTNQMLEEQQLRMQQQSEELRETNVQLEKNQLLMEEQTNLLNIKNKQLEISGVELMKHSGDLESANKYKSQFLANMSHELRTPLNSIILLSRLLMKNEKKDLNKNHVEKLDVIYNSGQELLRLINDILDLSKIEAGKMDVDHEEFYTKDLLKEVKQMFGDVAKEKEIMLVCEDIVNSRLYGDYNKISQIIRNLLSNAIKFTSKGTVRFEIKPSGNNDIQIIIADTGIGISKDNLDRIFEEFHQGDGSISRNYGGSGLGLSISTKLAEVMNGQILVQSEEGKGSSFTLLLRNITIPQNAQQDIIRDKVNFDEDLTSDEAAIAISPRDKPKHHYLSHKTNKQHILNLIDRKILIVDDDPRNIFVLASVLEDFGAEILEAESGKEALEVLEQQHVDLILMDIMMPEMDGYQVIQAIRESKTYNKVPIIAITAKSLKDDSEKCIVAGANDYISKPVEYDILIRLVKTWIRDIE
jgi:signal transduction histidine kinase/CheY-like chemotaxis protein